MPDNNNIKFGIDLLPNSSEQYNLGNSDLKWNIYGKGSNITNLNGSNITTGTISQSVLPVANTTTAGIIQIGSTSANAAAGDHSHGNLTNEGKITTTASIANGDKLVIIDSSSANRITGSSISFDPTSTTQVLTQAGTWSSFISALTPGDGLIKGTSGSSQDPITGAGTISIKNQGVTNNMLVNSYITIASNTVSLGGTIDASTLRSSLSLSQALRFIGSVPSGTTLIDGVTTTIPTLSSGNSYTPAIGDVILDSAASREYLCTNINSTTSPIEYTWELLGSDSSFATVDAAVLKEAYSSTGAILYATSAGNPVVLSTTGAGSGYVLQLGGEPLVPMWGGVPQHTHNYVDKTGDTMTGDLTNSSGNIILKSDAVDLSTTPESTSYTNFLQINDTNNASIGRIMGEHRTDGNAGLYIYGRRVVNSTTYTVSIHLLAASDGTQTVEVYPLAAWQTGLGINTKVSKTGDTLTGNLNIEKSSPSYQVKDPTNNLSCGFIIGNGHQNHGLYSYGYATSTTEVTSSSKWIIYRNSSGDANTDLKLYGAVWNDYAECRKVSDSIKPGQCVIETKSGQMEQSSARLQASGKIISDTFGFCLGQTAKTKTPIAVSGRVLAYPYQDKSKYELGAAVCTAPNGTIDIMTREEIMQYPERIIGTVSEIPDYEIWNAGTEESPEQIQVNGRIWIYVR